MNHKNTWASQPSCKIQSAKHSISLETFAMLTSRPTSIEPTTMLNTVKETTDSQQGVSLFTRTESDYLNITQEQLIRVKSRSPKAPLQYSQQFEEETLSGATLFSLMDSQQLHELQFDLTTDSERQFLEMLQNETLKMQGKNANNTNNATKNNKKEKQYKLKEKLQSQSTYNNHGMSKDNQKRTNKNIKVNNKSNKTK